MKKELQTLRREEGFTLVELAIVMIIIGLLIGGVLKGQELIANAQVVSTVAQIKGIEAATTTFRDTYNAVPGDMLNASGANGRLPQCTAAPCSNGNGNGRLELAAGAAQAAANESTYFWAHLNAADLFSGVTNTTTLAFGEAFPAADIGGGFTAGYEGTGALTADTAAANARGGHYIALRSNPTAAVAAGTATLPASSVARMDRKMDDGSPNTGIFRAAGAAAANTGCADGTGTTALYNERENPSACNAYIRIQG